MIEPNPTSWIPFVDPLPWTGSFWWLLSIPLAFGISMVHKAWRMPTLDGYWRQVVIMSIQVVAAMIALALGLALLVQVVVPMLP